MIGFSHGVAALLVMVPAALQHLRRDPARDGLFWAVLAFATLGPGAWAVMQLRHHWQPDFASAIWISVATAMVLFAGLAAITREAWRLTPLLVPYLIVLGLFGLVPSQPSPHALKEGLWVLWLHVGMGVLTYGLLTVAAVAALAEFLQERSLKRRQPSQLTHLLPSVADCESLSLRLLAASEGVLFLGLLSGTVTQVVVRGTPLVFDHKTLFTVLTFVLIGGVLLARRFTGLRGRRAARGVLVAWLFLTLGYVGVKFVTDVVLAA